MSLLFTLYRKHAIFPCLFHLLHHVSKHTCKRLFLQTKTSTLAKENPYRTSKGRLPSLAPLTSSSRGRLALGGRPGPLPMPRPRPLARDPYGRCHTETRRHCHSSRHDTNRYDRIIVQKRAKWCMEGQLCKTAWIPDYRARRGDLRRFEMLEVILFVNEIRLLRK